MVDISIVDMTTKVTTNIYDVRISLTYSLCLAEIVSLQYAAVDSDAANQMMDLIREKYVSGNLSAVEDDGSGIKLVHVEEFA